MDGRRRSDVGYTIVTRPDVPTRRSRYSGSRPKWGELWLCNTKLMLATTSPSPVAGGSILQTGRKPFEATSTVFVC